MFLVLIFLIFCDVPCSNFPSFQSEGMYSRLFVKSFSLGVLLVVVSRISFPEHRSGKLFSKT